MTTFEEAYKNVMNHLLDFGVETIELLKSNGRVLAEDVYADRDFPPFNRAAKDGIVIRYSAIEKGADSFGIVWCAWLGAEYDPVIDDLESSESYCFVALCLVAPRLGGGTVGTLNVGSCS